MIWFYEPNRELSMRWNIVSGSHVIAKADTEKLAKQIVVEHNAHAVLLAACDKLVSVGDDWQCEQEDDAPHVQEMRAALDAGIAAIALAEPKGA